MRTIDRIKKQFVEEGIEACLRRKPTTRIYERKVNKATEDYLITLALNEPPKGFTKWTLRLLADEMMGQNYIDNISHETVRNILKKKQINTSF